MRDLNSVANECMNEVQSLGIETGEIKSFVVNTRAKSRWGQCRHYYENNRFVHDINISEVLLDERNSIEGLKNTIIHEILHTVEGCQNHGKTWQYYADMVNKAYGYNIKRCSTSEEKGVVYQEKKVRVYKHEYRCKDCGGIYKVQRESKFTRNYKNYRCGRCGGEFEQVY